MYIFHVNIVLNFKRPSLCCYGFDKKKNLAGGSVSWLYGVGSNTKGVDVYIIIMSTLYSELLFVHGVYWQ